MVLSKTGFVTILSVFLYKKRNFARRQKKENDRKIIKEQVCGPSENLTGSSAVRLKYGISANHMCTASALLRRMDSIKLPSSVNQQQTAKNKRSQWQPGFAFQAFQSSKAPTGVHVFRPQSNNRSVSLIIIREEFKGVWGQRESVIPVWLGWLVEELHSKKKRGVIH